MLRWFVRLARRAAVLAALAWIARSVLKRWVDGPKSRPSEGPWPAVPVPAPKAAPGRAPKAAPKAAPGPAPKAFVSQGGDKAVRRPEPAADQVNWVGPEPDGSAPPDHPVKAKLSSHLYHEPGMAAYARTRPDRCYPSAEAAEADGFTRARR